jgi:integrase
VLGLQRDDIDVKRRVVHVRRQWASKQHPGKDHADRYAPPKDESYGDVQVFSDDFWARLITLVKSRPAVGTLPLFPSPAKPEQPASETWLRDQYRAAAIRAGITRPLDFHTLRHSGATWFGRTGASLAALMNFGRWRSVEPAMRYQHADAETVAYFGKRMGQ